MEGLGVFPKDPKDQQAENQMETSAPLISRRPSRAIMTRTGEGTGGCMLEAPSHDGQHSVPCSLLDHQMLLHHGQGQSQRTPLSRGQYIEGQELGTLTAVPCQGHVVPPYSQAYAGSGRKAAL